MQTRLTSFTLAITLLSGVFDAAAQVRLETDSIEKDYAEELVRTQPMSPEEALRSFQIKRGFRIELAASEPLISDPVAIAFDEFGRLFVVEMRGYSEQPEERLGRVRLLVDKDKDGRFDTASDYRTGLSWPTAIACYDGGVLLGHPPAMEYCQDTDDDGVADRVTTWADGFGRQNVQGMLNSFVWGLDGRLYGSTSSNGGSIVGPVTNDALLELRRRDFAIDFGQGARMHAVSGGGQHGMSFDTQGNRYVSSNSNHIQWVEFEEKYQSRNPYLDPLPSTRGIAEDGPAAEVFRNSPVEPWREVRTRLRVKGMVGGPVEGGGRAAGYFTGATGVTVYHGDAFPGEFRHQTHAFVGDVGGNLVHHKRIEDEGLSKIARRTLAGAEFLTSTDIWFRPCQFANGPDGALYVVDMYRETIEHPASLPPVIKQHLDLTSGRDRGRIYRVIPEGFARTTRLLPGEANAQNLVQMLGHSNGWHRETAMRLIIAQGARHDSANARPASQTRREEWEVKLRRLIVQSDLPETVVRALYCLEAWHKLDEKTLTESLNHADWLVRMHAIRLAESHIGNPSIIDRIRELAHDRDIRVRYQVALSIGDAPPRDRIQPLLVIAKLDASNAKSRHGILCSIRDVWSPMAIELLHQDNSLSAPGFAALTHEVLRQVGNNREGIRDVVAWLQTHSPPNKALWYASLLAGTERRGPDLIAFLERQAISEGQQIVEAVVSQAIVEANDGKRALADRVAATERLKLARFSDIGEVLSGLLAPTQPARLRASATDVAGSYTELEAAEILLERVSSLEPSERRRVFDLACRRTSWSKLLLAKLENAEISAPELNAQHRQQLLSHRDADVAARAKALIGDAGSRSEVIEQFQDVLSKSGDIAQGKIVFGRICASCHQLDSIGHHVGPDLQPLRNRGAHFMLTNILDPNREVDVRYHAYTIIDVNGGEHSGIISGETDRTISLRSTEGKVSVVRRDDIEVMRSLGKSLMPEGLEKDLDPQSLADLIGYLIQH